MPTAAPLSHVSANCETALFEGKLMEHFESSLIRSENRFGPSYKQISHANIWTIDGDTKIKHRVLSNDAEIH